jgi:hypothetical protein
MILLEKTIDLNEEEKELFNTIKGNNFPLYFTHAINEYYGYMHCLKNRDGEINSYYYPFVESFFLKICKENNINVKTIYRASINSSDYNNILHSDPHRDHEFDHYIFLMYINKFDNGFTYIFDEEENIKNVIYPNENKIVIFKDSIHAQGFCNIGQRRLILIITFGIEEE